MTRDANKRSTKVKILFINKLNQSLPCKGITTSKVVIKKILLVVEINDIFDQLGVIY